MKRAADYLADSDRAARIGLEEAVLCEFKEQGQIERIVQSAIDSDHRQLLTRLQKHQFSNLSDNLKSRIDYEEISRTGIIGSIEIHDAKTSIGIVTAGTSDVGAAREAVRTLAYHGYSCEEYYDVGVAGLWRLMRVIEDLRRQPVLIIVAGMDAALPSVAAGLVSSAVIAVPTSVGYGVAKGGQAALQSILSSCAPGITTVNIDNGYGAACAAIRIVQNNHLLGDHA